MMNNLNVGSTGQSYHQQQQHQQHHPHHHPFHPNNPQCIDHRYMGSTGVAGGGGYFLGTQQQQQPFPPMHHPQQPSQQPPQNGGAFFPGSRHTNIMASGGPPLMNSQYTNTFLMNCYQGVAANGWAGVPLISTAKRRPPRKSTGSAYKANDAKDFVACGASSMSKMALHAHGAPLILTSHGNNGANVVAGGAQGPRNGNGTVAGRLPPSPSSTAMRYRNKSNQNAQRVQLNGGHHRVPVSDNNNNKHHCERSIKFVTDETSSILSNSSSTSCSSSPGDGGNENSSSSGVVSDACLPRIIKPRKRRKKERKPGCNGLMSGDPREDSDHAENHQDISSSKAFSEEDFEDDEAVVTDFTTSCSCRLCDPNSHVWSFPLRRGACPAGDEEDHFADTHAYNGIDLYQLQVKSQQQRAKDVGVIGGNRVNQQRNEWRGSPRQPPQQLGDECDNNLFNAKTDNVSQRGLLMGTGRGGVLFGGWPLEERGSSSISNKSGSGAALSDEDSLDSFSCANAFVSTAGDDDLLLLGQQPQPHAMQRNGHGYHGLSATSVLHSDEDEELLIENLANLLKDSPKCEARSSDSSGVSSASDCGSAFGECYSPLVNLGSPPSFAFSYPTCKAGGGIFPIGADSGLMIGESPPTATIEKLLLNSTTDMRRGGGGAGQQEAEEHQKQQHQQQQQQQHVLNCLDRDWYRAATANRRLLMPYSNN